jgi:hypothetical protein
MTPDAARARGKRIGRPRVHVSADKIRAMLETGTPWESHFPQTGRGDWSGYESSEKGGGRIIESGELVEVVATTI